MIYMIVTENVCLMYIWENKICLNQRCICMYKGVGRYRMNSIVIVICGNTLFSSNYIEQLNYM